MIYRLLMLAIVAVCLAFQANPLVMFCALLVPLWLAGIAEPHTQRIDHGTTRTHPIP
jgi:hypothetical protein